MELNNQKCNIKIIDKDTEEVILNIDNANLSGANLTKNENIAANSELFLNFAKIIVDK